MNIFTKNLIKNRLFGLILLMSVFGINNSYAQWIYFDSNSAEGGAWRMSAINTNTEHYDGSSDIYEVNFISGTITLSTISSMFGSSLVNLKNYTLVGWSSNGVTYGLNDAINIMIGAPAGMRFSAIWSQQQQPPPRERVTLKWKVSVNNTSSFADVPDRGTTTVVNGNSLFLQAYIETENITYDRWEITYTASNDEYHYDMPSTSIGSPFIFNDGNPYNKVGRTTYTINSITLYNSKPGSNQPSVVFQARVNYDYTLEVVGIKNPELQWAASINTRGNFIDYDKQTSLKIGENDSIYLLIRISGGNITYNTWSFDYTVTPDTYTESIPRILSKRFDFNKEKAYNDFENINFTITNLHLYNNNQEIANIPFNESYAFTIEKESSKVSVIEIEPTPVSDPFCSIEKVIGLPFKILQAGHQAQYSVSFSENAKMAGFKDITSFSNLPSNMSFELNIPEGVPTGAYSGVINLKCESIAKLKEEYPFTFGVVNNGVAIVDQPETLQSLCGVTNIALVVDVTGNARSYQWYNGGQAIAGAKSRSFTAETVGRYHLEIMGECGIIRSEDIVITSPSSAEGVNIKMKWGNVLYIENSSGRYQRFQWYHDGNAISGATFVYHSEKDGFLGEYSVRCFKADGSYDETCPVVFATRTRTSSVSVYPSVLKTNDLLNINIQDYESNSETVVEIYSITGVKVYNTKIDSTVTTINPGMVNKGIYFVKVTLSSGEVYSEKIIVL